MAGLGEFEFIRSYLAPLSAQGAGAADLTDDGAVLDLGPGERLAVTADTLIEGRHFLYGDDPALAARKALRVNLSDLAAMGAKPFAYTTSVVWPEQGRAARAQGLVAGLAQDQEEFGVCLIGGDTTTAAAPWTLSVTAFGRVPVGVNLRRSSARSGDLLVVTGAIGDAGLGLAVQEGRWTPPTPDQAAYLSRRFQRPDPRIQVGLAARGLASAAIDVSDGLLSEARHIASASGLSACIDLAAMPVSDAARAWLQQQEDGAEARLELAASGDDYELLLAVPANAAEVFFARCRELGVPVTVVGALSSSNSGGALEVTSGNQVLRPRRLGFTQF